jgi:hypothetical protein
VSISQRRQVIFVDCPICRWAKAVFAYEKKPGERCFLCPHCQHVWDVRETRQQEHARLLLRTRELREEHDFLKKKPFDQAEHTEHKARLRKHLVDLRGRQRR